MRNPFFKSGGGGGAAALNPAVYIATGNISLSDCYNGFISNYGQVNDVALTLPTALAGMSLLVVFGTAVSKYFRVLPATGNSIYYEAVTLGSGSAHYVGVDAAVVGQVMQFVSFRTGANNYDWIVMPNFSGLVTP